MLHKSTKIIAAGGVSLFIVSVTAFVLFLRAVENHKVNFIEQTTARAELEAHRATLERLMRTLEDTKEERASLFSRVLKEEEVIDFLALIESLGREQGVTLATNALTVEPIDSEFETLVVRVSVGGSYSGVMQVLKILENLPYQASVADVQLTMSEGEGGALWQSSYSVRVTKFKKQ